MNVEALRHFSDYLALRHPQIPSMAKLNRSVVLGFVTYLNDNGVADQSRSDHTSGVRLFLDEYRIRDDWGPALQPSAVLRHNDVASPRARLLRPIPEAVMRQIESERSLSHLPVALLALVLIGIRCGLRSASARTLLLDCLRYDSHGQPSLVYLNTKTNSERAIPIVDQDVEIAVKAQQEAVRSAFPNGCRYLFPKRTANPDGERVVSGTGIQLALTGWIERCDIRDPTTGKLARFTYHQFRHTFATRLIENGASEYFVSLLLDHKSQSVTRGYAQLSDQRRRAEFDRVAKINNRGEVIQELNGPAGDAAWLKQGLNRIQVTLPNGYCGLPPQQPCEMRNACLDCDDYFITSEVFLPVHEEQLSETRKLIAVADSSGHFRTAEKNRQVEEKLVRIIDAIQDEGPG